MDPGILLSSWILTFLLQALRVIFSTLFGVIYDQIFEGPMSAWLLVSNGLVILALLAPALLARKASPRRLILLAILAILARVSLSIDDASIRYWGSLALLATAGSYLWLMLRRQQKELVPALIWGISWEYLLRVLGDTFDLSLHDGSLTYVAILGSALITLALWVARRDRGDVWQDAGIDRSLALGLGSFLFLETTLFGLPSAVARYSTVSYPAIAVLLFFAGAIVIVPSMRRLQTSLFMLRRTRWGLSLLVVLGFVIGYFGRGWLAAGGLILGQWILVSGLAAALEQRNSAEKIAHVRLSLGLLWMLVLNFFNAFAFTYPYTLPLMRERGWLVYLVAILVFAWWLCRSPLRQDSPVPKASNLLAVPVLVASMVILIATWPKAPEPLPRENLRLATWNIHYGYDDDWHTNLQEMAAAIEKEGVDVIAVQEVDAGRMTSYSSDNAYFLARRLGMQVAYLPTVEHLTGIALLYKGPPAASDLVFVTSLQEQTGVVHVALDWGSSGLDAYGIWMGLSHEETMRQIEEALSFIGSASPASFGGDFNARPEDAEIDSVRASGFADPFDLLGIKNPPPTSPAINPQERIDFVWLRGLIPQRAWVSESLASDHRMVIAEVGHP